VATRAPVAPLAPPAEKGVKTGLEFNSSADVVVSPRRQGRRGSGLRRLVVSAVVVVLLGGASAGGIFAVWRFLPWDEDEPEKSTRSQGNFSFKAPRGWKFDPDLRARFHVNLALTRKKPSRTHMGLYYRDYKTRSPGDGELLDVALRRLRAYFPQFEYEDPLLKEDKGRSGELGGEPALVVDFAGSDATEVPMRGRCLALTRQGYAYWFFTWGPEDHLDDLEARWEKLRAGFRFHDEREGWRPQPRKTTGFRGITIECSLDYIKDVWKQLENPRNADDRAELVLHGFEPIENEETGTKRIAEYSGKLATVQVLLLERAASLDAAAAAALEHVRKRQMDLHPAFKLEPVKDKKTGKPLTSSKVGSLRGRVSKLRLQLDADTERYGVLAVANQPDGVLAVFCDCRWDRRAYWDQEFEALLGTVRLKGKKAR
jgi:hypothetical protein